jgi:hypothetical protein
MSFASYITSELMVTAVCCIHQLTPLWHSIACKWGWNQQIKSAICVVIVDCLVWLAHWLTLLLHSVFHFECFIPTCAASMLLTL